MKLNSIPDETIDGTPEATALSECGSTPQRIRTRIAYLDGWRGLAIITVLIGHFGKPYWDPLYLLGGFGVELFFVLSGRLMADILFISRHPLPDFFRRRFARIFPALLVFACAMAAAAVAVYAVRGTVEMEPWEFASAITFTINYVQALSGEVSSTLGHIWSLSIEEHCYVLLALIALLLSRRVAHAKWLLAILGLVGLLNGIRLYEAGAGGVHDIYWRTDVRLAPVFLSAASFLWLRHAGPIGTPLARVLGWMPIPCVALSAFLFFVAPIPVMYTASALLLMTAVNTLDFSPAWLLHALSARALTTFGFLSYSIYLWQQPLYHLSWTVPGLLLLPVAIGLGAASYYFVEKPARRWMNGLPFGPRRSTVPEREWVLRR